MSKLYTIIGLIMLLTSCADNEALLHKQKVKLVEKEVGEKLSHKNAAKLLDSAKAQYGDSVNYVSDIFVGVVKDTVKHQNK